MIRQAAILFGCLGIGELMVHFTPIRLPSSIIGMLMLTLLLKLGWIKLSWVEGFAGVLTDNLGFFFIPAGVGVMLYFDLIGNSIGTIAVAAFGSTALTLILTAGAYQYLRRKSKK